MIGSGPPSAAPYQMDGERVHDQRQHERDCRNGEASHRAAPTAWRFDRLNDPLAKACSKSALASGRTPPVDSVDRHSKLSS